MQKSSLGQWSLVTRIVCLTLMVFSVSNVYAAKLPPEENAVVDKIFNLYNQAEDIEIIKNNSTGRFQASSDFISFKQDMVEVRKKLGKVVSKEEKFLIINRNLKNNFIFYHLAFNVHHDKGLARHYVVLMLSDNKIKIGVGVFKYLRRND